MTSLLCANAQLDSREGVDIITLDCISPHIAYTLCQWRRCQKGKKPVIINFLGSEEISNGSALDIWFVINEFNNQNVPIRLVLPEPHSRNPAASILFFRKKTSRFNLYDRPSPDVEHVLASMRLRA